MEDNITTNKKSLQQEMELFCETHQYQGMDGVEVTDTTAVEEEDDEEPLLTDNSNPCHDPGTGQFCSVGGGRSKSVPDHVKFEVEKGMSAKGQQVKEVVNDLQNRYPGFDSVLNFQPLEVGIRNAVDLEGQGSADALGQFSGGRLELAGKIRNAPNVYKLGSDQFQISESFHTLVTHELGHFFHEGSAKLSKEKFGNQNYINNKARKLWRDGLAEQVSQYAKTTVGEMMAESFSAFTHPSYRGDLPKPLHDFMTEILT